MAFKCWKKSQTSSGFYKKTQGKVPVFVRFERNENAKGHIVYDVLKKTGLGDSPIKQLGRFGNKSKALKFAKAYMRKNDAC